MLNPNPQDIRTILHRDRNWALYALGDLSPRFQPETTWLQEKDALALIYRGGEPPVLFAMGDAESLRVVFARITESALYLSVKESALAILADRFDVGTPTPMHRMIFQPGRVPDSMSPDSLTRLLTREDEQAVLALFCDGEDAGEAPDFFQPWMLTDGVFYGIWKADQLVAVGGTHLVSETESVAAVGNIYTRRDQRGRGFGTAVTMAVTQTLRRMGIATIGLNVKRSNAAAIRAYQHAGFEIYCDFVEGVIKRAVPD